MGKQYRFSCRICKTVQNHGEIADFNVGDAVVCAQCLGCGVIGIHLREKEILDGRNVQA